MTGTWTCVTSCSRPASQHLSVPLSVCPSVCLSVCLSLLYGKHVHVGHYVRTFQPTIFMPALLTGIVDLFWFLPLTGTWTLDTFGVIFSHICRLTRITVNVAVTKFKSNIFVLRLCEIYLVKRNKCCPTDSIEKNFDVSMYSNVDRPI